MRSGGGRTYVRSSGRPGGAGTTIHRIPMPWLKRNRGLRTPSISRKRFWCGTGGSARPGKTGRRKTRNRRERCHRSPDTSTFHQTVQDRDGYSHVNTIAFINVGGTLVNTMVIQTVCVRMFIPLAMVPTAIPNVTACAQPVLGRRGMTALGSKTTNILVCLCIYIYI